VAYLTDTETDETILWSTGDTLCREGSNLLLIYKLACQFKV